MYDSNLTHEYFIAVCEFNLSWEELVSKGQPSLLHSFLDEPTKQRLVAAYDQRIRTFAARFRKSGWGALRDVKPSVTGLHAGTVACACSPEQSTKVGGLSPKPTRPMNALSSRNSECGLLPRPRAGG
jgi:hypothetical protein